MHKERGSGGIPLFCHLSVINTCILVCLKILKGVNLIKRGIIFRRRYVEK